LTVWEQSLNYDALDVDRLGACMEVSARYTTADIVLDAVSVQCELINSSDAMCQQTQHLK